MPYPKGKPKSEKSKRKTSETLKGHIGWSKGIPCKNKTCKEKENQIILLYQSGKSMRYITKQISISLKSVQNILKRNDIKTRTCSEAKMGIPSTMKGKKITGQALQNIRNNQPNRSGRKNPNYKNPKDRITPLNQAIRLLPQYVEWQSQVRGRDNWTCQKCGCKGWMEAHHIKSLSSSIKENNINSGEEATMCNELWDLNNGITYCLDCHKLLKCKGGLL